MNRSGRRFAPLETQDVRLRPHRSATRAPVTEAPWTAGAAPRRGCPTLRAERSPSLGDGERGAVLGRIARRFYGLP
jgi:hypothetical protein